MTKAVVLLSGGLDSATVLAIARHEGYELCALSFRYGQRHVYELECAQRIARAMGVARHEIVEFDLRQFGGSALTSDMAVPKDRARLLSAKTQSIPTTYVPARNTIFLSFALAWAETLQASDLFVGVNALDYSGYPDCRPEYIEAFEKMAQLATKAGEELGRWSKFGRHLAPPGQYVLVYRQTQFDHDDIVWGEVTIPAHGFAKIAIDSGIRFKPPAGVNR